MAGKLDQSLDDILKTRRGNSQRGRGRGRRVPGVGRTTATVAPVGGVTKTVRVGNTKATHPVVPITGNGESKIIVTGLPSDVTEAQIKEYFTTTIGPVKKVFLTYGPNGQSRGISTIVFNKPGSAVQAATQLNGVKVDNRAMKIEVVVGADQAPVPVPPKALGERIAKTKTGSKAQPKPVAAGSGPMNIDSGRGSGSGRGRGTERGRGRGGRRSGRGKPKTAEELDAEMTDYFDTTAANGGGPNVTSSGTGNASNAAAIGGDTGMDDEIMVLGERAIRSKARRTLQNSRISFLS